MSAAYLSKQKKTELSDLAEASKLPNYANLKKSDLEVALDEHLRANQSSLGNNAAFGDYYKKLGSSSRSPVKKIADKVTEMVRSEDDAPVVKKQRRKTVSPEDKAAEESSTSALSKTPARDLARKSSNLAASIPLPASPAAVTDAIERQTRMFRNSVSEAYKQSQITEYTDYARETLSSPLTVNALGLLVELIGVNAALIPFKAAGQVPSIRYMTNDRTTVYVPDLFVLLGQNFWAPFSLWLVTSFLVPLAVSYFINLPLRTSQASSHGTRRSTSANKSPEMLFDPFIFNIAKALMAYVVYAQHFSAPAVYTNFNAETVNQAVLGGYLGMMTSAGVGALVALYDAILKK